MSCTRYLDQYVTDTLVETGSGKGRSIAFALACGFKEIYSVEISERLYKFCSVKFSRNENVHLSLGESVSWLQSIVKKLTGKTTFLLDAHILDFAEKHAEIVCPILQELEIVLENGKQLGVRHIILIDDAVLFNGKVKAFGNISKKDICDLISRIDPKAKVTHSRRFILVE